MARLMIRTAAKKTLKKVIKDDDRKLINVISQVIKKHATNYHENSLSMKTEESSTYD